MPEPRLRIGDMASRAEVSTRTVRYYEEIGLLRPSGRSPGGARRYDDDDLAVLLRIRELQQVMGFDLDQIRAIVSSEARLRELKRQYTGEAAARRREIVREAIELNDRMREEVRDKLALAQGFLDDLDAKAQRYRGVLHELDGEAVASH